MQHRSTLSALIVACLTASASAQLAGSSVSPWPKLLGNANNTSYTPYITTATPDWLYALPSTSNTSPAVDASGNIYVTTTNCNIYCISPSGTQNWGDGFGVTAIGSPVLITTGGSTSVAVQTQLSSTEGEVFLLKAGAAGGSYVAGSAELIGGNYVSAPAVDVSGNLWVATGTEFYRLTSGLSTVHSYVFPSGASSSPALYLNPQSIEFAIGITGRGCEYVGSTGGLGAITLTGGASYSTPAVVGNELYLTSASNLYALTAFAATSPLYTLPGTLTSPVYPGVQVLNSTAYSLPILVASSNGNVYVCSLTQANTYATLLSTGGTILSAPAIDTTNGYMWVSASNGIYCVNLYTGVLSRYYSATTIGTTYPESNPVAFNGGALVIATSGSTTNLYRLSNSPLLGSSAPKFRGNLLNTGQGAGSGATGATATSLYTASNLIFSSPAVDLSGNLYFGSLNDYVYSTTSTGALRWSYQTGGPVEASAMLDSFGNVYIGSTDGYMYCLSSTGSLLWKYQTGSYITSSATIGPDGTVYFGSYDDKLYALTSAGALKWTTAFATGSYIFSSPVLDSTNSYVYVTSEDKSLYEINCANGAQVWKYTTGSYLDSSPAVDSNGNVYFGSCDDYLYCVTPSGALNWKYKAGGAISTSSPAIDLLGNVYFGCDDGKFYSVSSTGKLNWNYLTKGAYVDSSPLISKDDSTVYVGGDDGNLYAFGTGSTLNLKWKKSLGGSVEASPVINSSGLIYVAAGSKVYSVN